MEHVDNKQYKIRGEKKQVELRRKDGEGVRIVKEFDLCLSGLRVCFC